jgi:hypothetical protein
MYHNIEKLAANTADLRRFARQHIWNAPNRGFGARAERAMEELPGLRRELRGAERAAAQYEQDLPRLRAEAEASYQEQLREHEENERLRQSTWERDKDVEGWRAADDMARARAERELAAGSPPERVSAILDHTIRTNAKTYGPPAPRFAPRIRAVPDQSADHRRADELREQIAGARESARSHEAAYDMVADRLILHGSHESSGARLLSALHENNERLAGQRIERVLGRRWQDATRRNPMPQAAADVLHMSSHATPSVPLRDVNIANTAWGPEAADLQSRVHNLRHSPRSFATEIEGIGRGVPGAQQILENARILPGAPVPETPGYVQHAQQRLIGAGAGAAPSPAVQQRLQQIVDMHQANTAPTGPARLNSNELRMIDESFHRQYNPQFPQLLSRDPVTHAKVPVSTPQTPTTPLPAEQRGAFREALAAQPGLTRKQFLAR